MNVGIFAVISHVGGYDDHLWSITDYRGLGYRSPVLAGAMAFFLLSLIGIPFTGGFFAKFYVFSAALQSGMSRSPSSASSTAASPPSTICACSSRSTQNQPKARPSCRFRVCRSRWASPSARCLATLLLGIAPRSSLDLAQRGAESGNAGNTGTG